MERKTISPRGGWQAKVEALGFNWHTGDQPYWDESAYWSLSQADVDRIAQGANDANKMILETIEQVIKDRKLALYGYSPEVIALIEQSWEESDNEPTIVGRFDFAYDGVNVKLLEFNGDNPGAILETAIIQQQWQREVLPAAAQFNTLHDTLVAGFRHIAGLNRSRVRTDDDDWNPLLHITAVAGNTEAEGTAAYIQRLAQEGGVANSFISIYDIGISDDQENDPYFVDLSNNRISQLLKLVPLSWILSSDYGPQVIESVMNGELRLLEPAWKLLASNKRLLADVWDRYTYHPVLLNTAMSLTPEIRSNGYVRKPVNGMGGQNVELFDGTGAKLDETGGEFANDQAIYQERATLAQAGGQFAVFGCWFSGGNPVAVSIREANTAIVDDGARFIPHVVE